MINYNARNIFLQQSCNKWGRKLVQDLFLFYKKSLYQLKASGFSIYFGTPQLGHRIKANCIIKIQSVDPEIYAIFYFLEKGWGSTSSPQTFQKIFTSFLPSSDNEKMGWGRGWQIYYDSLVKYFSLYILLTDQFSLI